MKIKYEHTDTAKAMRGALEIISLVIRNNELEETARDEADKVLAIVRSEDELSIEWLTDHLQQAVMDYQTWERSQIRALFSDGVTYDNEPELNPER